MRSRATTTSSPTHARGRAADWPKWTCACGQLGVGELYADNAWSLEACARARARQSADHHRRAAGGPMSGGAPHSKDE